MTSSLPALPFACWKPLIESDVMRFALDGAGLLIVYRSAGNRAVLWRLSFITFSGVTVMLFVPLGPVAWIDGGGNAGCIAVTFWKDCNFTLSRGCWLLLSYL